MPDPQFFYQSPTHEEALARLHFLVEQHRRLGLLMGPDGSGKSFLLEVFAEPASPRRAARRPRSACSAIEPAELLWQVAVEFGLNPEPAPIRRPPCGGWLSDRLLEYRYQQTRHGDPCWTMPTRPAARCWPRSHASGAARSLAASRGLTLVLAGRQERMGRIGDRLLGLADLRIDIQPWGQADTENYLKASLAQAGCQAAVFAEPAVGPAAGAFQGIPRRSTSWPIWPYWPARARTCRRSARTWSNRPITSWAWRE